VLDEVQVTPVAILWLVPSEYVPVAANCWVSPTGMPGLAGLTAMEERVAEVTVRVLLPEVFPEVTVMVVVPGATGMARPLLFTFATEVSDEVQVTPVVILWLVPSEYVPVAANCWVSPTGMLGLAGVTDMEVRVAGVTVTVGGELPPPPPPPQPGIKDKTSKNNINVIKRQFAIRFTVHFHLYCRPQETPVFSFSEIAMKKGYISFSLELFNRCG
jgi:hypothetical protein